MKPDPCSYSLTTTAISATGTRTRTSFPGPTSGLGASEFDCFYVYPTVSEQPGGNTDLTVQTAEKDVAAVQASPFSQVCDVWAPIYRSQTTASVEQGLAGDNALLQSTFTVAYDSLMASWNTFLAQDSNGRPIILIGDSQGSAILIHLIATEVENNPALVSRLVVAILAGGNLQVPNGKPVGATFTAVPLCTSATQTGCAIAFSSFPSQPPADSLFGRAGQGVSLQSGQSRSAGEQVACVNPASLSGGSGVLRPYFPAVTQTEIAPAVSTSWVTYPDLYSAACLSQGGATWLQVTQIAHPGDTRPLVTEDLGPQWGYHSDEMSLAAGNLVADVATEEASWRQAHP